MFSYRLRLRRKNEQPKAANVKVSFSKVGVRNEV